MPRFILAIALLVCASSLDAAHMTQLSIHIVTPGGKPLDRASVIVKFVSGHDPIKLYRKIRTTWETKTDQEGFARIPAIPQGKIQIQVIATNYQTFGQIFDVEEAEKTIEIKLNVPQAQYSAHEK